MSVARRVGKQAYIFFIGKLIAYITNLLVLILLARVLGANDYGIFSLGTTLIILLYSIFNFGIESPIVYYVSRFQSQGREDMVKKVFNTTILIRTITGITGSLILYFMSDLFESLYAVTGLSIVSKIFSLGFFGYSIIYLAPSVFQAFKKFKQSTISDIIISIIKIVLIFLTINYGLVWVTAGYSLSLFISGFVVLAMIYKKVSPRIKTRGLALRTIIKYSLITYAGAISFFIINYIGNLFVGSLPSQVSFLTIGHKIGMLIVLPASSLGMALFPNISGMKDKQKIKNIYLSITKYSLLVSTFFSFYIIACGSRLIPTVFGNTYVNSGLIISMLMLGYFFFGAFISIQILYQGIKKPLQVTYAMIIQALVSLALLIALTPTLQGYGAAIAFVMSNLLFGIILITKAVKEGYSYNFTYLAKMIITALVASSAYFINGLVIKSLVFGALFLGVGFMIRAINLRDIRLIIQAMKFTKRRTLKQKSI